MVPPIDYWREIIDDLGIIMDPGSSPSGIAGNDNDPIDAIKTQMGMSPPDTTKILADLDKIEEEMTQIVQIAVEHNLHPVNEPDLIEKFLKPTLALIDKLKTEIGTPAFKKDFEQLTGNLGVIKQAVLQGVASEFFVTPA